MITQKKCNIPIFNYKLTIIIFDDWKELEHYIPKEEFEHEAKALVIHDYGSSKVLVTPHYKESIIHESLHIKNAIWRFIGYTPQADNDEVDAYLITYIYQKILKVFNEHCK
jgi:hypothetical protein